MKASPAKRRLIKDPVWGNLDILPWEQCLINHFLFNRLHHIVQNSNAFKVYPGLHYSRFLHALGTCHVATQMFLNTAKSSERDRLVALAEPNAEQIVSTHPRHNGKDPRIKAYEALGLEADAIEKACTTTQACHIRDTVSALLSCPAKFAVLLAAIRLAALLHDIGHLPYSHLFENAIRGFLNTDSGISDAPMDTQAEQHRQQLTRQLRHDADKSTSIAIHETLGQMFLRLLRGHFDSTADISPLLNGAEGILWTPGFPIAKAFVSGMIDADRIDFVRRDGYFSGLFASSVDYERLFAFYELAYDSKAQRFAPRPSSRAVSEIEKVLFERFQDYKYIVVHHRVHLYDEIMENLLVHLMRSGELNDFLDTLTTLLNAESDRPSHLHDAHTLITLLRRLLVTFDDPWIDMKLRRIYLSSEASHPVRSLLTAYVEDRNYFCSAFKTEEAFANVCSAHSIHGFSALSSTDVIKLNSTLSRCKYRIQRKLSERFNVSILIGTPHNKLSDGIKTTSMAEFYGIARIKEFLSSKKTGSLLFNIWYERAAHETGLSDAIVKNCLEMIRDSSDNQLCLKL